MARPNIEAIVFDIGWVLVRLNHRPIVEFLAAHGAPTHDPAAVLGRIGLAEHECGRLPGQELLEQLAALTSTPVALERRARQVARHVRDRAADGRPGAPPE